MMSNARRVESSLLASVAYDAEAHVLEVEFVKTEEVYRYRNVTPAVFAAMNSAKSLGSYFSQTIKKNPAQFPFEKVEVPLTPYAGPDDDMEWGDDDLDLIRTNIPPIPLKEYGVIEHIQAIELRKNVQSLPERAVNLTIVTVPDYQTAAELLKTIKTLAAQVDETHGPVIKHWHGKHKEALAAKDEDMKPLAEAELIVKKKMSAYLVEEERQRKAEETRIRRENEDRIRKQVEEENLKEAQRLAAQGDLDGAAEAIDAKAEIPVIPVFVESKVPKVAGISSRKTYSARVDDLRVLMMAVINGTAPIEAIEANMQFLNAQARVFKKEGPLYPGTVIVADDGIAAGRL